MKTFDLKAQLRKDLGKKSSKKLRKEDMVPCVMYGGKDNVHFYVTTRSLKDLLYTPHTYLVNLDVDGTQYHATIQDVQTHPVSDNITHIDFAQSIEGKPVIVNMPVIITGNAVGVKKGGRLKLFKRTLRTKAFSKDLPDDITIDVTDLEINKNIKIKDLPHANITFLEPSHDVVVGVQVMRAVVEEVVAPVAGAAAEGAAPADAAKGAAPAEGAKGAAAPAKGAAPAKAAGGDKKDSKK